MSLKQTSILMIILRRRLILRRRILESDPRFTFELSSPLSASVNFQFEDELFQLCSLKSVSFNFYEILTPAKSSLLRSTFPAPYATTAPNLALRIHYSLVVYQHLYSNSSRKRTKKDSRTVARGNESCSFNPAFRSVSRENAFIAGNRVERGFGRGYGNGFASFELAARGFLPSSFHGKDALCNSIS